MTESHDGSRLRIGWLVFVGLALFTAIEFAVSSLVPSALPYLTITALVKAGLIIVYFMHVRQLFRRSEVN